MVTTCQYTLYLYAFIFLFLKGFYNFQSFFYRHTNFIIDYVEYQKTLEDLVATDCKNEPTKFYERLENVRLKRGVVSKDVSKLRKLAGEQMDLVDALKGTL